MNTFDENDIGLFYQESMIHANNYYGYRIYMEP